MKNRYLQCALKVISFILCFVVLFWLIQTVYVSAYANSEIVNEFYDLEKDSVDVLFLGPSQMYNGIDTPKLTDEYGISSYDFGGGGQPLLITYYYLQEALKCQKPKVVCVEMCRFFDAKITNQRLAYNYPSMPMTSEKYDSLLTILNGDRLTAAEHYLPISLIAYHSWWNDINPISVIKGMLANQDNYSRGFKYKQDKIEKVRIGYLQEDDGAVQDIPEESVTAILNIAKLCEKNDIELVFFKVPTAAEWTKSYSDVAKEFMKDHGLTYLEMNDYLDEIGIDPDTDFANTLHLNKFGADKATDFIAEYLIDTCSIPV